MRLAAFRFLLFVEHEPEKWMPVFRKDHAQMNRLDMIEPKPVPPPAQA
jgi:hypothetical protein